MIWPVLLLIPVGLIVSLPATWLLVRLGHRAGALDSQGSRGHAKDLRAIPNVGGIAIYLALAGPMMFGLAAIHWMGSDTLGTWIPSMVEHLPRIQQTMPTAIALLVCLTVLHVVGLVDDRRSLSPLMKLASQIIPAAVLAIFFDVRLLTLLDGYLPFGSLPSVVVTILWIVAITNAINFMDNMDGLAAGVSAVAAAMFMAATLINAQWFIAATLALLIGALVGFLIFNFPPAKIFMGDGGSLVIGFLLAVLTARTTFYDPTQTGFALGGGWYGVFMPLAVLAVPLYDLMAVTFIRLRQGRSPLVGDQQHFSHRLVQRGLSKRGAVIVIWAATAVTGIGGISLGTLQPWQAMLVGMQIVMVLLIIAIIEYASRRAAHRNSSS